jgi:hypothetical protein
MVAAGHDEDDNKARKGTPIERVVNMARGMIDVVQQLTAPNGQQLMIRIVSLIQHNAAAGACYMCFKAQVDGCCLNTLQGIHCGPAFAGVIGAKCPRYCFLGDTVNTASRMETLSYPMCVQLSGQLVAKWPGADAHTVLLGDRSVKGKGKMETYLLKVRACAAGDGKVVLPL